MQQTASSGFYVLFQCQIDLFSIGAYNNVVVFFSLYRSYLRTHPSSIIFSVFSTVFSFKRFCKDRFTISNESAVSSHHSMAIWIKKFEKIGTWTGQVSILKIRGSVLFLRIKKIVRTYQINCIHCHL